MKIRIKQVAKIEKNENRLKKILQRYNGHESKYTII